MERLRKVSIVFFLQRGPAQPDAIFLAGIGTRLGHFCVLAEFRCGRTPHSESTPPSTLGLHHVRLEMVSADLELWDELR